jgi:hypothetical protein
MRAQDVEEAIELEEVHHHVLAVHVPGTPAGRIKAYYRLLLLLLLLLLLVLTNLILISIIIIIIIIIIGIWY